MRRFGRAGSFRAAAQKTHARQRGGRCIFPFCFSVSPVGSSDLNPKVRWRADVGVVAQVRLRSCGARCLSSFPFPPSARSGTMHPSG